MSLLSPALVLVAHPRPDSFNHAIAATVGKVLGEAGCRVLFHDLYAEDFAPLLSADEATTTPTTTPTTTANAATSSIHPPEVEASPTDPAGDLIGQHRRELATARTLAVIHPNWWGMPPAILVGWLDRVVVPGVAYRLASAGGLPESLVRLDRMLVINTTDTPPERERSVIGDPLQLIWRNAVGPYLGDPEMERLVFPLVTDSAENQRRRWLAGAGRAAAWLAGAAR